MIHVCFGHDHQDRLIMTWNTYNNKYSINFFEEFYKTILNDDFIGNFYKLLLIDDKTLLNKYSAWKYLKDENYNLADTIEQKLANDYRNDKRLPSLTIPYPLYILRNNKWHYCSPDTDFILIPCEGEFTDVTKLMEKLS